MNRNEELAQKIAGTAKKIHNELKVGAPSFMIGVSRKNLLHIAETNGYLVEEIENNGIRVTLPSGQTVESSV